MRIPAVFLATVAVMSAINNLAEGEGYEVCYFGTYSTDHGEGKGELLSAKG